MNHNSSPSLLKNLLRIITVEEVAHLITSATAQKKIPLTQLLEKDILPKKMMESDQKKKQTQKQKQERGRNQSLNLSLAQNNLATAFQKVTGPTLGILINKKQS